MLKEDIFKILKEFSPNRYDAYKIAIILKMETKEKRLSKILFNLARDMPNIHFMKDSMGEVWFYYNKEEMER